MGNYQEQGTIVTKIGTDTLVRGDGRVDTDYVADMANQIAHVRRRGSGIAVVCSGALTVGGQEYVTDAWTEALEPYGIQVAETLISDGALNSGVCKVRRALAGGQMPLINADHSGKIMSETVGNNDFLAAAVARRLPAQGIIFLTNVDGVLDENGKVLPTLAAHEQIASLGTSTNGTGGMIKKVTAARTVVEGGRKVVIAHGRRRNVVMDFAAGRHGLGTTIGHA